MIFAREPFAVWHDEARALFAAHYDEVATHKEQAALLPDFDLALTLEAAGRLIAMTARETDGALLGYAVFITAPHPHYRQIIVADCDLFYLMPGARSGLNGYRFLAWTHDNLLAGGVDRIRYRVKRTHDWSRLLTRLGAVETERVFEVTR